MTESTGPGQEHRRIAMLHSLGLAGDEPDRSLKALAAVAADIAGTPTAFVGLIDSDRIRVAGGVGIQAVEIDRWDAFSSHALLEPDEVLWVADAHLDPRFAGSQYVVAKPFVRFYAHVPLCVNGCLVGSLCVFGMDPKPYDESLSGRLKLIGKACAAELAERHRTGALRQALAASADGLVDCDADGLILNWSEGAERLFGFSQAEAVGGDITMIIPETHQTAHREGMRRWRESGAARLGRRLELPARRRDGADLDIELWMSVSHDNGEPRVHANIRDISARRKQARELDEAVARAEEASQAKTAFLANMSHELRTPLNGVTACSGLLAASSLTPDQARLVQIISEAGDQLSGLIADILDLARIESGELKLSAVPTDLEPLVDSVVDLCRLKADEKGILLRLEFAPSAGGALLLDGARLRQVLGNLLSNAIKFTSEGEVVLRVTRSGPTFLFEVADTGIGFDSKVRDVIFDRFQQADSTVTRRFGGTGLGLAICRDLVQAMGGSLDCRSTPGDGSVFWVRVDLEPAVVSGAAASTGDPTETELRNARVLVVDDNPTNRQVVGLILQAAGIISTFAENGREALEAASNDTFDLILMDMMMPEMDGIEATRKLRAGEAGGRASTIPVIMLTANTLPEHVAQTRRAGADGHLAKPITPSGLLQAIGPWLSPGGPSGTHAAPALAGFGRNQPC